MDNHQYTGMTRREFVERLGVAGAALGLAGTAGRAGAAEAPKDADGNIIPGFEKSQQVTTSAGGWQPYSDRKIRVGIAGYGLCHFGGAFFFQDHPNVEVVAVTDLIPARRAALAQRCGCSTTYESCEKMLEDDNIEAVFIATDAPSHARLAVMALERGKHVASAVPAVYGSLEDADLLFEAYKKSGRKYMMFETSAYHADLYGWHQKFKAGAYGKVIYSEGEYYHYFGKPIGGYNPGTGKVDTKGWRNGLPPMWYPTHNNAYYICITGGTFTEVSCMGNRRNVPHLQPENNEDKNPFGTEVALFKTSEGGMSRQVVGWDMPSAHGEKGRFYGEKNAAVSINTKRPPLPPGISGGGHGGSHGHLTNEFVDAILRDRDPWVDIAKSLNMTVAGIVAHQSALKDGELMKVPQYTI